MQDKQDKRKLAIEVDNVQKIYKLYDKPSDRMKEAFGFGKKTKHKLHYALKGVDMKIYQGETVGIIGTNGSGKSTILKIITGVLNPTSGRVLVNGRISALLELGAGFNMEYNGIENVYLNGTMMGFSEKEIEAKLPDILSFADIGDYVYQPVKTYSSGMFVRLAFAVAINIEPEILIVDDGSKDGTTEIADRYQEKYPTIVKAIHQENKGHGGAVNTGVENATGLYFKVVDSDDWVNPEAYQKILNVLAEVVRGPKTLDLLISNYVYEKEGAKRKRVMRYAKSLPEGRFFGWDEAKALGKTHYLLMHSLIYRTSLLRECGMKLPEHTFYVDNLVAFIPLPYVKTMYYLDVNFYRYFIGRADQSVNEKVMIGRIDQQIRVNKLMIDYLGEQKGLSKHLRKYMISYLTIIMTVSSVMMMRSGTEENLEKKNDLWRYLKQEDAADYFRIRHGIFGTVMSSKSKPGQKIAFVGSTGAGKTTITNLINRFYDVQGGTVVYDGIDVRKIKKDALRHSLGIVLQDTHLFTGTVADNIRFGKLDATQEEIERAARIANAHSFIRRLPDGYDTMVTADGANLSQGQRQLLAIARAAVADPPVLILDEATSSIDTRTELQVQEAFDKLMKGRTSFIVAHRLSTIRNASLILVMKDGKIIEQGNHEELLKKGGFYHKLYHSQFEG